MKSRLIYKFILSFAAATLVAFLVISYVIPKITLNKALQSESDKLYVKATSIASDYGTEYFSNRSESARIGTIFDALGKYIGCDIMLLSSNGEVLIDTGHSYAAAIADFDPADAGNGHYVRGTFHDIYKEDQISVFYPVEYRFTVQGYVVINKPVSEIRRSITPYSNYNYFTFLITVISLSIIIFLYAMEIIRPLNKLTKAVSAYAKGDFSIKTKLGRSDELGRLSDSLDYMAMELDNLNDYQKKFIANISHDFRSPLTSIKGYLEAMLDGTIPPEMQGRYLNIVISETERLTKLTNNLLTMNSLNNGSVLDISDFDITTIIRQTIGTCEGICEKKNIKFKLVFSDKALMVTADQSKIQQVIYNLVDNAIKFSNADSSIIISAYEKGDKIMVSVKDFGIGIPKDSISKIWDRFYKTDLSRGKDKKGTGLGLAIVKDIIKAHDEYIDVISTEGVGTEFIFGLPRSKKQSDNY